MADKSSPFKRPPLTNTQIRRIREAKVEGVPVIEIARRFGVPVGKVGEVAKDVKRPRLMARAGGAWGWTARVRDRN